MLPKLKIQQTFAGLVFKTSCKHVLMTYWKTKNCYPEDVLKTCWRQILKTSWRHFLKTFCRLTKCLLGISASNHDLLVNLNQYLESISLKSIFHESKTNPKFINYNPRFLYSSYFETQSSALIQNRHCRTMWGNKNEVLGNILHRYNESSFILTFMEHRSGQN